MFSFPFAGSTRVVLALAIAVTSASSAWSQDAVSDKFKQGADLYFRGKVEEALKVFQEVLAENPSNEQALKLYDQAGREVFALMLQKGGEFETTAKRFLELASVERKGKTDDKATIDALVEKALSGNYLERRDAIYELSANHGEYGAAPFVAHLGDEDDPDKRTNAMVVLVHMSGDSVLPLLAGLQSGNDRIVRNACACLGNIRDSRSVAGLKTVYDTSTNEVSKNAAADAIEKITGRSANQLPDAASLHVDMARKYFRNEEAIRTPFETTDAIWKWNGSGVEATKVPAELRKLRLAEQNCLLALGNPKAQAILIACFAGEKAAIASAKETGAEGDVPEIDPALEVKVATGGPPGLSAALTFALENEAPTVAVELLKQLESTGATTDAMRAALASPYKSVRYEAAFALAGTGDTSEPVVKALGEALGEDAMRTVLVVDDKSESRNAMTSALRGAGYTVITADSGGLGFARARTLPPKDVIVVRAGMSDVGIDQFVYDSDFRTAGASFVLVTDAAGLEGLKALYDGKGKVKAFVSDPVTADALLEAVKATLPDLNYERAQAMAAAERAAGTLGHVPAASLAPISGDLVKALSRSEEPVLLGVLKAVGHSGASDAAPATAALLADTGKSEAIRVAAADALAGIFSKSTTPPAEDVMKAVKDAAAGDASMPVRLAASRALGAAAFLNANDRAELLRGEKTK
jgi:HEAT repeat protein